MQSSGKPLCSVQENMDKKDDKLTHSNFSVANIAPCDSSIVENHEVTIGRPSEVLTNDAPSNAEVKLNDCKKTLPDKLDCLDLKYDKSKKCESNEVDNITNAESDNRCSSVLGLKRESVLEIESKNLEETQVCNLSQLCKTTMSEDVISETHNVKDLQQNDMMIQGMESKDSDLEEMTCSIGKKSLEGLPDSADGILKSQESSEIMTDSKFEDNIITTTNKLVCEGDGQKEVERTASSKNKKEKSAFFCSTPIVNNVFKDNVEESIELNSDSPLNTNCSKGKMNLKRTNLCLERIEEVDESADGSSDKRLKLGSPTTTFENKTILQKNDGNVSSSMPCFEAPAKSILKKWYPSGLSRDSYLVVDECGESDAEETVKPSQESVDHTSVTIDDFEVACKSLAEELLMSSSNYETLEKYHSQVQLDSQMDDKKFDEVLQELTLNYDLDDKTFLSKMKPLEESSFVNKENVTNFSLKTMEESVTDTENEKNPSILLPESASSEDKTILAEVKGISSSVPGPEICLSIKQEGNSEASSSSTHTKLNFENEKPVTIEATDEKPAIDEEDVLLEENIKFEQKQYVYFEYVSADPKENEDNYNPEWQKLGKLTNDEERYKAVRDRWRSLVPPDPNRDLTCRQWRKKNNKPPLNIPSLNNNQRMFQFDSNEKNQLCTAVFETKIANVLQELQKRRMQITKERQISFEKLAVAQDEQQRRIILRGTDAYEMSMLQKHHIQECVKLKNQFDMQLEEITKDTEKTVMVLKKACDEVMSFQKFYKGVGATNKEVCIYMSDIQVEELMETEEMLEQYSKYYQ